MKHALIKLTDIPETGTVLVPFFGRELHVFLSGGKPRAVANVCHHFGGPLECKGRQLVCTWHGATYDMDNRSKVSGPGPSEARLMALSTRVEDGTLYYVWGETASSEQDGDR